MSAICYDDKIKELDIYYRFIRFSSYEEKNIIDRVIAFFNNFRETNAYGVFGALEKEFMEDVYDIIDNIYKRNSTILKKVTKMSKKRLDEYKY